MSGTTYAGTPADEDIHGTRQDDTLSGGAGDDTVRGRRGDDTLVYDVALNAGATDTYDGGIGLDTIRLLMTSAHWNDPAVQLEIAAYLAFLDVVTDGGTQDAVKEFFYFESFGDQTLRVTRVEALEIFVDGVQVTPEDDPVTAVDDAVSVDEDGPALTGNVLANDSVPDLLGSVTLVIGTSLGNLTLNPDGSYSYMLDNTNPAVQALGVGQMLTDSFTYLVADADGDTDFATVTITINGTNDSPTATDDAATTDEDTAVITANVLANDSDPDTSDTLVVAAYDAVSAGGGTVSYNGDGTFTYDPNGMFETLNAGDSATDTFTYTIDDGHGGTDTATVTVTIDGVDDGVSGVVDFTGGHYWYGTNAEGGNTYHVTDDGLQVRGIGDDHLDWYLPPEGAGDGFVRTYDYDYGSATNYEGKGRIEGEGGTGTFSLKSLDIEYFRDYEGDGWSVTFTGSNGASQTVTHTGTGSPTSGSHGTVNFGAAFTDVAWVDWDFTGDINNDGTAYTDYDYFNIDNLVFEDLQGTTPYVSDPDVIEFDRGQSSQVYVEDGFSLSPTSGHHHVGNFDGSDADWEFDLHGNYVYELDRGDGGSFDLESIYIVLAAGGVTFTGSNGATHTVAAGTTGTTTFDASFHDITSVTITNGSGELYVDDITFANIEVV
ncbi:Ig-like domain-containing protein [Meridianimarinicoccus sp. MJW13]|uniref:Ig-like domain-containing protein n=1 Tax=Meridianimarinicoccus sp. MJW13 TaxID=2720031 RepID=UPI001866E8F4|nr:Ig-like domain-containing protein [Fluviibacterium sp. MJW13]